MSRPMRNRVYTVHYNVEGFMNVLRWVAETARRLATNDDIAHLRAIANAAMGIEVTRSTTIHEMLAPMLGWDETDQESAAFLIGTIANARIAEIKGHPFSTRTSQLSSDQMEILRLIAGGKTNVEISLIVGRSKRSIDYHVTQILQKLDVASRVQAAALFAST